MYTAEEEVINSATHFLSAIASALFTILIVGNTSLSGMQTLGIFLVGLTGTWTFLSSYLYHSSKKSHKRIRNQILDKSSIYIMIGGNGAGVCMLSSSSVTSLIFCLLLVSISCLLAANFCLKPKVTETFTLTSYLLLGWLAVIPASGLLMPSKFTDLPQLIFLLGGGVAYSLGVVFYVSEKKWYHTVWHGFTMLGFGLHLAGCYYCL